MRRARARSRRAREYEQRGSAAARSAAWRAPPSARHRDARVPSPRRARAVAAVAAAVRARALRRSVQLNVHVPRRSGRATHRRGARACGGRDGTGVPVVVGGRHPVARVASALRRCVAPTLAAAGSSGASSATGAHAQRDEAEETGNGVRVEKATRGSRWRGSRAAPPDANWMWRADLVREEGTHRVCACAGRSARNPRRTPPRRNREGSVENAVLRHCEEASRTGHLGWRPRVVRVAPNAAKTPLRRRARAAPDKAKGLALPRVVRGDRTLAARALRAAAG